MSGPYATEADAMAEPLPLAIVALYNAGLGRAGLGDTARLSALTLACEAAGVEPGTYGLRVLHWLSRCETGAVQVIADLIIRAAAARASGAADGDVAE